jgi:DNA-binding MarR family transcriptional regulator
MSEESHPKAGDCNCLAVRQAARHVTQFYDQFLAPIGLRMTQFSVLSRIKKRGPMTINALAAELVMDRTTLGRNILPLERERLITILPCKTDRRSKELHLTELGRERYEAGAKRWAAAQRQFDAAFGDKRASELRAILHAVTETNLGSAKAAN